MYSKCGTPEESHLSFNEVTKKDLVSWTSMISVYAKLGCSMECLRMFFEIQVAGISPDGMVISCVLTGIANSMRVYEGKAFHGLIFRRNFEVDQMAHNALLSMYLKFGLLALSEKLFYSTNGRDKESWNIMVVGNSKGGLDASCIKLFREMQMIGVKCDSNSLVSLISSCSRLGATRLGRSLHCHVIKKLFHDNISVTNSIIDMYGKSGNLTIAQRIFCMTQKDAVTWNALINSYAYNKQSAEALALFDSMVAEAVKPSSATLVTALSACSHIASLEKGEQLHNYIKQEETELNLPVATALIDMYAKCGRIEKSREIFDSIEEKDVICWNVMISGYGMHGDAKSAIEIFKQSELSNCRANELTFLAVLLACSHAGLVEEGKFLFDRMKSYFLRPSLKHYACMVDLLGRSGNLNEAEALSLSMPVAPDGGLWGALLNACRIHNNTEMGIRIAKRAIRSDPNNDGYYIMLSDLYSTKGMWKEAEETRTIMKEKGVRKTADELIPAMLSYIRITSLLQTSTENKTLAGIVDLATTRTPVLFYLSRRLSKARRTTVSRADSYSL
ncbi:hypothetical protein RJ639_029067 [Escallonia herrerae]|uniref:Pentatricopeptide repeat-containing protein n=1 Tax=Escallonia herrerae TaxID=1293975 RepID=A0AA88X6T4_9ASTE|nr:hypothetical protein RJ639_029067 [Escallonia herrerae]